MRFSDINDYIGEINLDLSNDSNVLAHFEAIGDMVEEDILRDLLDDKLYNSFIADLDVNNDPQTQLYIDLLDGKTYTKPSGKTVDYDGLKRMLRYFIWAYYQDEIWSNNVSTGQIINANENSTKVNRSDLRKLRAKKYNHAIKLYNEAIQYLIDERETYFPNGTTDYQFWYPKSKTYIGVIRMGTPNSTYFTNRSSKGN